jgi:carbon-monoxide dehydrogenase iron sulfur subunit
MKYLKTHDEKCIGCNTCVLVCSRLFFKEDDPGKSCIQVFPLPEPDSFRLSVCNQCGTCVEVCPTDALSINKQGVVMLNKKLCSGCYVCVDNCPTKNMRTYSEGVIPFKCTACGACARECPAEALEIVTEENKN